MQWVALIVSAYAALLFAYGGGRSLVGIARELWSACRARPQSPHRADEGKAPAPTERQQV